jgi:hypothetical protein
MKRIVLGLTLLVASMTSNDATAQYWHALPSVDAPKTFASDFSTVGFTHDEKRVLFLSSANGTSNIYSAPVAGGEATPVTAFTDNGVVRFVQLVGQPNLVFMRPTAGGKDYHLYRVKNDGTGPIADLTPTGPGVSNEILGEAYNGRYVYFTSNKVNADKFDGYRYDAMQLKNELIFPNDRDWQVLGWSRDTKNLLLEDPRNGDVMMFDLSSTDRTPLAKPAADRYLRTIMDPASRTLMVIEKQPAGCEKKILDFGTKRWTNVKEMNAALWHDLSDASVDWIDYSPNGKYIVFHTSDSKWSIRELPGGADITLPANAQPLAISSKETLVAYTIPTEPARKIYVYDIAKKTNAEVAAPK